MTIKRLSLALDPSIDTTYGTNLLIFTVIDLLDKEHQSAISPQEIFHRGMRGKSKCLSRWFLWIDKLVDLSCSHSERTKWPEASRMTNLISEHDCQEVCKPFTKLTSFRSVFVSALARSRHFSHSCRSRNDQQGGRRRESFTTDIHVSRVLSKALYKLTAARSSLSMPFGFSSDSCVNAVKSPSGI